MMRANIDREGMIDLLAELVRCPTENTPPDGRENIGQAVLQMHYQRLGLQIDRFSPASLPEYPSHPDFLPRNLKGRENLVGIWKGSGGGRSLLLTGHMDVVPKEPMPWKVTEPYVPLVQDGKMFGRGTADMKAGLTCAVAAVKALKAAGFEPRGDVVLESVVDEEYAGANGTVASRLRGYNPDFAVVLEPSGLNICPACVGGLIFRVGVKGIAGMPYTGESIGNPAYDIAELIQIVRAFGDMRMEETPVPKLWEGTVQGVQIVITKVKAGEAFEGGQLSAPIDGWLEVVVQSYPGETQEQIRALFEGYLKERYRDPDGLAIECVYRYCRPAASDPDFPGVQLLARCAAEHTDLARVCGAMFSCDMFALTEIGKIPSAIFGPIGARLHAPDEWVDLESMEICVRTLMDFIEKWCG